MCAHVHMWVCVSWSGSCNHGDVHMYAHFGSCHILMTSLTSVSRLIKNIADQACYSGLNTVVSITLHDMASPHSGQTRHRSLLVLLLCKTENFPWPSCSCGVFVIKPNQALGSFNSWINTRSLLAWCPFSQLATPNEENHFSSRKLDPLYSVRNYL